MTNPSEENLWSVHLAVLKSIHYDATVTTTLATPLPPSTSNTVTISPQNPHGFVTTTIDPLPPHPPLPSNTQTMNPANPNGFATTVFEPYPTASSSPSPQSYSSLLGNATSAKTSTTATIALTPPLSHLPYYTTTTTTLHTTLSATISQVIHLSFPLGASGGNPTLYTVPPLPTSEGAKAWAEPLPIAVVTQLEAVVFDDGTPGGHKGQVLTTITAFARPADETASPAVGGGAVDGGGGGDHVRTYVGNSWGDWTEAQRGGVIAAVVIVGVLSLGMVLWCLFRKGVWGRRGARRRSGSSGRRSIGWGGKKLEVEEMEEEDKTEKNITRMDKGQVGDWKMGTLTKDIILGMGSSRGSSSRPRVWKDIEADAVNPRSQARSMTVEVSGQSPKSAFGPHHISGGLPHSPPLRSPVRALHLQRPVPQRRLTPVKENDDGEEDTKRLSLYRRWRLQNKRA